MILGFGCWVLDFGFWEASLRRRESSGFWMLDFAFWFLGFEMHPEEQNGPPQFPLQYSRAP